MDLFDDLPPPPEAAYTPIAPGAVLLRAFARPGDAALLQAVESVISQAPLRHMQTPGGYTMSVATTSCGPLGWVSDPHGYRYAGISGEVTLSPQLATQAKPDDVLFVFARAEDGQRMPLAVVRSSVAALPLRFHFDDSMALPGGRKLSEFKTVSIEARIAKAGKAQTSSGDLFGSISGVKPGKQVIRLSIDRVQP